MDLFEPHLHKRVDHSEPLSNKTIGCIEDRFTKYNRISFHFGVKDGTPCDYAWKVFLTNSNICLDTSLDEVYKALENFETIPVLSKETSYLKKHNLKYSIIIFNDSCRWTTEANYIIKVDLDIVAGRVSMSGKVMKQKEFQQLLVDLNGINQTFKPLIYATTEFEGYLSDICKVGSSRTDASLFPGDVDLALYDDSFNTICIVEFKKHTKNGDGPIQYQSFRKYYYKDRRKYSTLGSINGKLGKEYFYNLIYSTRDDELNKIKIEKIQNRMWAEEKDSVLFEFASISELETFLNEKMR